MIDQWEELYTLCKDDVVRQRFLDEVLATTGQNRLSVILTLRGDFYGHALSDRALADRLQDAVVNLGPMTHGELGRAIVEPARKVGLEFEEGLIGRILDDVGDEPGNLPLLEFVLEMLWQRREHGWMHHAAYEAIGKVQGAIAQKAEEFAKLDSGPAGRGATFADLPRAAGRGHEGHTAAGGTGRSGSGCAASDGAAGAGALAGDRAGLGVGQGGGRGQP